MYLHHSLKFINYAKNCKHQSSTSLVFRSLHILIGYTLYTRLLINAQQSLFNFIRTSQSWASMNTKEKWGYRPFLIAMSIELRGNMQLYILIKRSTIRAKGIKRGLKSKHSQSSQLIQLSLAFRRPDCVSVSYRVLINFLKLVLNLIWFSLYIWYILLYFFS